MMKGSDERFNVRDLMVSQFAIQSQNAGGQKVQ